MLSTQMWKLECYSYALRRHFQCRSRVGSPRNLGWTYFWMSVTMTGYRTVTIYCSFNTRQRIFPLWGSISPFSVNEWIYRLTEDADRSPIPDPISRKLGYNWYFFQYSRMKLSTSRSFCVSTGRSAQDSFNISTILLIRIVLCQTCAAHLTHESESENTHGSTRLGSCPSVKIATA